MGKEYGSDWIERAHWFAVRVLRLANKLPRTPVGLAVADQISRSVQGISYNLEEAKAALTEPDTLNKTAYAKKESYETRRALMLIRDVPLLPPSEATELEALVEEGGEFVAMLTTGTKRLQAHIARNRIASRALRTGPAGG